jgi:GGDEF domain-containing protein
MNSFRPQTAPITLGIIAGIPVYGSVFLDTYLRFVIEGIRAAALNNGCSLLVSCGVRRTPGARSLNCSWPVPASHSDFLPVGPWNTAGLIVFTPLRSRERSRYVQRLRKEGFPVVFIGGGEEGPSVMIDNEGGIHQAVEHLVKHGHRRIAFIAGEEMESGDSAQRLRAFQNEVRTFHLDFDSRLVAFGHHQYDGGRYAMERMIASGVSFTAVVASNDTSALGVMDALRTAGRRIPADVAVIGFDDQPATAGLVPPLTSVHYPLYEIGVRAIHLLLRQLGPAVEASPDSVRIPAWLAVRESCGCPKSMPMVRISIPPPSRTTAPDRRTVAEELAAALPPDVHRVPRGIVQQHCQKLTETIFDSLQSGTPEAFESALQEVARMVETLDESTETWQSVITALRAHVVPGLAGDRLHLAEDILHHARLVLMECAERQNMRRTLLLRQAGYQIGWMSARMYAARDEVEFLNILSDTLPSMGIRFAQIFFFEKVGEDPFGGLRFFSPVRSGQESELRELCCATNEFPLASMVAESQPFSLALLPLAFQAKPVGFVAFDAVNLDPLATIVRQISAPLKKLHLERRIWDLSLVDGKIGISNRRFFDMQLGRETTRSLRYKNGLAVLLLAFKQSEAAAEAVNPPRSEAWIRMLAGSIAAQADGKGKYICRFDKNTIGAIFPETGLRGLQELAGRIRNRLQAGTDGIPFPVCMGGAACEDSVIDPNRLVECAEHAINLARMETNACILQGLESDSPSLSLGGATRPEVQTG